MPNSPSQIIAEIAAQAQQPLAEARALPAAAYTCPAFFDLERNRIFEREWICIGHVAQVPSPGDYVTADLLGAPIVIARNTSTEIRVFANSCAHRGTKLLSGAGNTRRITCPYHAWTYDLGGRLIRAPHMPESDSRLTECRLPQVNSEIWHGWIYATLNDDPAPLASRLEPFADVVAPYQTDSMILLFALEEEWPVNWKCLAENFMESYHVSCVHPKTVARATPTSAVRCSPGGDAYTYHTLDIRREKAEFTDFDRALPAQLSTTEILGCIFPSHLISVTARNALSVSIQPLAVDRLRASVTFTAAVDYLDVAGLDRERMAADALAYFNRFNAEDKAVNTLLFAGLHSSVYRPGPLSPLEQPLWEFHRYLASRFEAGETPRI